MSLQNCDTGIAPDPQRTPRALSHLQSSSISCIYFTTNERTEINKIRCPLRSWTTKLTLVLSRDEIAVCYPLLLQYHRAGFTWEACLQQLDVNYAGPKQNSTVCSSAGIRMHGICWLRSATLSSVTPGASSKVSVTGEDGTISAPLAASQPHCAANS